MIKLILLLLLFIGFSKANDWLEPAYGLWGVGAASRDLNYKASGVVVNPVLFIFGGYGPVFIEANRLGYSIYRDGTYFASLAAQVRTHQFRAKDNIFGERKRAIEAGLQIGRRLPGRMATRLAFLHDLGLAHKSWELDWQVYRRNLIGPMRLLTAVGLQYQSKTLVDYYYGTSDYSPKEAFVGELEIIATYPFGEFGVFAGTRIYLFDGQVANSPIADGNRTDQFFGGFGYRF
jgi:outer membrane scaffolding protein for murein synthesis (MipA/OmpV family)